MLLRILFRPIGAFYVRIINQLIRRRSIQFLRRRATRDRATTFASQGILRRLIFKQATRYVRHAFRFTIGVPHVNDIGGVLRFNLAHGRYIRLFQVFVVLQRARLLVSFFMFNRHICRLLRSLRRSFLRDLHIIGLEFLYRVACEVSQ